MLRRGQTTTFQERLDIIERAAAGQSDPQIAAALGCSVWTARKWRRRGQQQGRTGLSSPMGRPTTGPLRTLPTGMRDAILQMRRTHPGWGPTTLLAELRVDPRWSDLPFPSRSRIAALLRAEKLTRRYQKHSALPSPAIQPQGAPHDEWELDAQGSRQVAGVGKVRLISVIDVVSRLKVESYPCLDTTNPPLEAYELLLRRAFLTTGWPRRITFDHGTVFYENTSPSPFPTCLHLWLLADGASTSASPASVVLLTMPRLTRTHQTMTLQALLGQHWSDQQALWAGLDARRTMLNQPIPSSVLQGHAPLQASPEALHSGRVSRPEGEAEMLELARVFAYLAHCRWFRRIRANGRLDLGGDDDYLGTSLRNQMLEVHFAATQGCFLGQLAGSESILTFAQKAAGENRSDGRTRPPARSSCVSTGPPLYSAGMAPVGVY